MVRRSQMPCPTFPECPPRRPLPEVPGWNRHDDSNQVPPVRRTRTGTPDLSVVSLLGRSGMPILVNQFSLALVDNEEEELPCQIRS